jgi:hypothetical protein
MTRRTSVSLLAVAAGLVFASTSPASAAHYIFTPPLLPPPSGSLLCDVINTADAPISFAVDVVSTLGFVVDTLEGVTDYPSGNRLLALAISTNDLARFCRVTVFSGNRKNLRVSLQTRDSMGVVLGAVEGR